jgi:hypothetical protein
MVAVGGSLIGKAASAAVSFNPITGGLPDTEGLFLISESQHRIFFIRSSYLPFFEVTDIYDNTGDLNHVITSGRALSNSKGNDKWDVLYSDEVPTEVVNNRQDLDPPSTGKTYIAMSLSPSIP